MTEAKLSKESKTFEEYLEDAFTYEEYLVILDRLLEEGKTTGPDQTEAMVGYGRLNRHRMRRLDKTVNLESGIIDALKKLNRPMIWLTLTEGWCGDAAQNIPVIERIAAESGLIATKYLLRDENPELMDRYLTNGAKSIPMLLCLDAETLEVLGRWGSRPKAAQQYFLAMREAGLEKTEMSENIQRWYFKDKEKSIQKEFVELIGTWTKVGENYG